MTYQWNHIRGLLFTKTLSQLPKFQSSYILLANKSNATASFITETTNKKFTHLSLNNINYQVALIEDTDLATYSTLIEQLILHTISEQYLCY